MRIDRPPQHPRPPTPAEDRSSQLWQVAQGMEANFLKQMMRQMRKTIPQDPALEKSNAHQMFQGWQDDQYAETAAKTQGIGLAELIVKQVMEMQENARNQQVAPPVRELNKSDIIRK